jgi:hypothetical protein
MPTGFAKSLKGFAIGTDIFIFVTVILKISKGKLFGSRPITQPAGKSFIAVAELVVRDIGIYLFFVALGYIGYAMVQMQTLKWLKPD